MSEIVYHWTDAAMEEVNKESYGDMAGVQDQITEEIWQIHRDAHANDNPDDTPLFPSFLFHIVSNGHSDYTITQRVGFPGHYYVDKTKWKTVELDEPIRGPEGDITSVTLPDVDGLPKDFQEKLVDIVSDKNAEYVPSSNGVSTRTH